MQISSSRGHRQTIDNFNTLIPLPDRKEGVLLEAQTNGVKIRKIDSVKLIWKSETSITDVRIE